MSPFNLHFVMAGFTVSVINIDPSEPWAHKYPPLPTVKFLNFL